MATRSIIAVMTSDCIKAVYCHWDGYPDYNGKILNENYTKEDALKLLEFGQISGLGETIESCVFYHRDRGEELSSAESLNNIEELIESANDCGAEYVYLFDNEWLVCDTYSRKSKFVPLISVLANIDDDKGENMKEVIENNLKAGNTVTVTFTKKDGTQRVLRGTTNPKYIPPAPVTENEKPKRAIASNPDVAKVFDLDINEWRSFRYDSVTQVEVE